jgi:hypothetical protein
VQISKIIITWVISKVLHTVCFLLKNEFILQNTFTGLHCNLHCLYHSGTTFGKVLYSCLVAFVFDASDYAGHLIRHLLNASEAFPTEWFLRNKSKSVGLSAPKLKKPLRGKRFRSIEEVSNEVTCVIRRIENEGVQTGIQDLPRRWTTVIKHNGDYIEGL